MRASIRLRGGSFGVAAAVVFTAFGCSDATPQAPSNENLSGGGSTGTTGGPIATGSVGGGGSPNGPGPEIFITFPPAVSVTDGASVIVRGTATDADGVVSISINDEPATSDDGFATWQVEVPLVPASNVLRAKGINGADEEGQSAQVKVRRDSGIWHKPSDVSLDTTGDRAFVPDGATGRVYSVDLLTGKRSILAGPNVGSGFELSPGHVWNALGGVAWDAGAERLLATLSSPPTLFSIDIDSSERAELSGPNVGVGDQFTFPNDVVMAADSTTAYVGSLLGELFQVQLDSGDRTFVAQEGGSPAGAVARAGDDIYIAQQYPHQILRFSPPDVVSVVTSDALNGGPSLFGASGLAIKSQTAYITKQFGSVIAADLITGERVLVADASKGAGPELVEPRGIEQRSSTEYIVADAGTRALLALDVHSGARFVRASPDIGQGPAIRVASGVAEFPGGFLVTDLWDRLYSIAFVTGDRDFLSDGQYTAAVGSGPPMFAPVDVVFDGERALVAAWGGNVVAVQLTTGDRTLVSGLYETNLVGTGPLMDFITGAALDRASGRVLLSSDDFGGTLYAVDIITGNRTIISGPQSQGGDGPPIKNATDIALYAGGSMALLATGNGVLDVNLSTGDRTFRVDCLPMQTDLAVAVSPDGATAYVADNRGKTVFVINNNVCEVIADATTGFGPALGTVAKLDIDQNGNLRVLSETLSANILIDVVTGHRVVLAQ